MLRELSYAIKNQLKPPTRGISYLSLNHFGIRIGALHAWKDPIRGGFHALMP